MWFLPLGGTGEIGMNLNLYGHANKWLMVDCGVTFKTTLNADASQSTAVHEVVCADPSFISKRKEHLAGIVITHAHEDHIGAVPYLWPRFGVPVYATAFSAAILRRKIAGTALQDKIPIVEVQSNQTVTIGPFTVTWMAITHSLPEPQACFITTEAGSVFHTADWKIDRSPVTGSPIAAHHFQQLGKKQVSAMVCDSTNALKPGHSVSESACYGGLLNLIHAAKGRVVVGCFSSNIARLITLARVAKKTQRYLALFGRSLQNMLSVAKATGHWPPDLTVIDSAHAGYLLAKEVLVVATGSQGEPRAALNHLAQDSHRHLSLDKGDLVIFSSIIIPGNERAIQRLVNTFASRNIQTLQAHQTILPIHASGHPNQDELRHMYDWIRPQLAIATHGEVQHMQANAKIASECHVPRQLTGMNGDLFVIAPQPGLRKQAVKTARIALR